MSFMHACSCAVFSTCVVGGALGLAPTEPREPFDERTRSEILRATRDRVRSDYFDEAKGRSIAAALEANERSGAYEDLRDPAAFAEAVTEDMKKVTPDTHLKLLYSAEIIPADAGDDTPETPAEQARRAAEWAHANFGFLRVERWPGNVGYLDLDSFADPALAGATAAATAQFLAHTDAIVIDLRYNPGGHGAMVALLASYFLDGEQVHLNDYFWRSENRTKQSWSLPWLPGVRLASQPLFIVTSARTHSAAEEFCYDLQSIGRATIVGERTRGGAHPAARYRLSDHFGIQVPIANATNPKTRTNWEGVGVKPDVEIDEANALDRARLLATEAVLAHAADPELRAELGTLVEKLRTDSKAATP